MKYIFDYIIILLILYLAFYKKSTREGMSDSILCDKNIKNEVEKIFQEDLKHIKKLGEISEKMQSKEGFKMNKDSIIEVEGDIIIPNGIIDVVGKNNYLENLIFDNDKISVYHNATGYRLEQNNPRREQWRGFSTFGNRISYNKIIDHNYLQFIWTVNIKKGEEIDNTKFVSVERSAGIAQGSATVGGRICQNL